jgi:hypothetical protein
MGISETFVRRSLEPTDDICPVLQEKKFELGYRSAAHCLAGCTVQEVVRIRLLESEVGRNCIHPIVMNDFPVPPELKST